MESVGGAGGGYEKLKEGRGKFESMGGVPGA